MPSLSSRARSSLGLSRRTRPHRLSTSASPMRRSAQVDFTSRAINRGRGSRPRNTARCMVLRPNRWPYASRYAITMWSVRTAVKQFSVQARQSRQFENASSRSGAMTVSPSKRLRKRAFLPRATWFSRPVARYTGQVG